MVKFNSVSPKELRLGNYIKNLNKEYVVTDLTCEDLNRPMIGAEKVVDPKGRIKWGYETFIPIEITKEFLLKNGFNNYNNRYELLFADGKIILDGEWLEIRDKLEPGDFCQFLRHRCRCKYIHQLQNALIDANVNINLNL